MPSTDQPDLTWRTPAGGSPCSRRGDTWSIIRLPLGLSCPWENPSSHHSTRPLLPTGSVSHCSCHLAQEPSSLLSLPLARFCLYLCKRDSKASRYKTCDTKASRLRACRDEVWWNYPFLNVLRLLSWLLRPQASSRLAGLCPGWLSLLLRALLEWYSQPPSSSLCFVFGPQEHPLFALPGKKGADCSWTVTYALFPSWPLLFISFLSLVLYECVPIIPSECTITHPIALSLFKNSQNIWMSFSPEKLNFMNNI